MNSKKIIKNINFIYDKFKIMHYNISISLILFSIALTTFSEDKSHASIGGESIP